MLERNTQVLGCLTLQLAQLVSFADPRAVLPPDSGLSGLPDRCLIQYVKGSGSSVHGKPVNAIDMLEPYISQMSAVE